MLSKYKKHELGETHINMNPMIDVVFQLLLFFILASNFSRPNQIQLDLPSSNSAAKAAEQSALVVSFRQNEGKTELRVNGTDVGELVHLGQAMRTAADPAQNPRVEIRIDKATPYQDVISIMDAVRDAGFPHFSLLTLGAQAPRSQ
ncbi:MAG: biopolymer transporter ExbD [Planctomycetota bacterium]|nr:biopolymer transporter ExbD [Planctomycetota bacterium]